MYKLEVDPRKVEELAYRLWQQRGCPTDSPDHDWSRAEKQLLIEPRTSWQPLYAFGIERKTL